MIWILYVFVAISFVSQILAENPWDEYDSYVFALQWGYTMCLKNKQSTCLEKFKSIEKYHLSIHGLWPGLSNGQMLDECNQGDKIKVVNDGSETFKIMEKIWPSLNGPNEKFWTHEYNKHGFCYNKRLNIDVENYKIFFDKTIELYYDLNLSTLIKDAVDIQNGDVEIDAVELSNILKENVGGDYFRLICSKIDGKNYLNEIRFAFDSDLNLIEGMNQPGNYCKDKILITFPQYESESSSPGSSSSETSSSESSNYYDDDSDDSWDDSYSDDSDDSHSHDSWDDSYSDDSWDDSHSWDDSYSDDSYSDDSWDDSHSWDDSYSDDSYSDDSWDDSHSWDDSYSDDSWDDSHSWDDSYSDDSWDDSSSDDSYSDDSWDDSSSSWYDEEEYEDLKISYNSLLESGYTKESAIGLLSVLIELTNFDPEYIDLDILHKNTNFSSASEYIHKSMDQRLYKNFTKDYVPFGINKFTTPEEKSILRMLVNLKQENLKSVALQISAVQQLLSHLDYNKFDDVDLACNTYFYHYYQVLEKFKDNNKYYSVHERAHELYNNL